MQSAPGSPEFVAEWQRLTAGRDTPRHHAGTVTGLLIAWQATPAFADLSASTREGYARRIRKIEAKWGTLPIAALPDPRTRGLILDWRDTIGHDNRREADYCITVFAAALAWAKHRGKIPVNPLERPGRLYSGTRAEKVWSDAEIEALLAKAPAHVALPVQIALHTGQREGDVLRLSWSGYDGQVIRLRQAKTGRHVRIPVTAELRTALDAAPRHAVQICTTSRKTSWTLDGFKSSFAKAKAAAGITDRTFHDLRGTAVTRLALAGCTVPEIATITGHDLKSVESILSRHYLSRDSAMGDAAIAKLEKHRAGTKSVNGAVNGSDNPPKA